MLKTSIGSSASAAVKPGRLHRTGVAEQDQNKLNVSLIPGAGNSRAQSGSSFLELLSRDETG